MSLGKEIASSVVAELTKGQASNGGNTAAAHIRRRLAAFNDHELVDALMEYIVSEYRLQMSALLAVAGSSTVNAETREARKDLSELVQHTRTTLDAVSDAVLVERIAPVLAARFRE